MKHLHWNHEWDEPDPLKGRRGWALHHYVNIGVKLLLLLLLFGVLISAFIKQREVNDRLQMIQKMKNDIFWEFQKVSRD